MSSKTINLIVWSSIFAAAFLFSLIMFLARPGRKDRLVLFFPSETTAEWVGEGRNIPHMRETEDSVHELLKEIALGPTRLRLDTALPKQTRVRSVVLREDTLYVDFSEHVTTDASTLTLPLDQMLEGVKKSVLFNFPDISDVVIFVRGYPVS